VAGSQVGRYKLLQPLGEGGCGVVYLAEQDQPVRRRVALKVIKAGMDTKHVLARFEAERQALALMDHPNIATVLDAGSTENGRPFFVMELVKGVPITRFCDEHRYDPRRRLALFIQVCQAIQHAHQKGIIHRDIKPSNVLVADHNGVPVPKVIDFGLAKATNDQRLTDNTLFTAVEQFLGTPAYMSPEQAGLSGWDVDTRTDIYSLGVLLYELLTGRTPFENKRLLQAGLDEIRRIIREDEPPRPSTRLSTMDAVEQREVAKQRQSEPPKLLHLVRGDLDWIAMKALEKDRSRRYETAVGFARDVQRHLDHEPVVARPPSGLYRLRKMVRRNRLAFAAAAATTLTLLFGLGLSLWLLGQERKARQEAEAARTEVIGQRSRAETATRKSRTASAALQKTLSDLYTEQLLYLYQQISRRSVIRPSMLPDVRPTTHPDDITMTPYFLTEIERSLAEKGLLVRPQGEKFAIVATNENDFARITPELGLLVSRFEPLGTNASPAERARANTPTVDLALEAADLDVFWDIYGDLAGRTVLRHPALPEKVISFHNVARLTTRDALYALTATLALNQISVLDSGDKFLLVFPAARSEDTSAMLARESAVRAVPGNELIPAGGLALSNAEPAQLAQLCVERLGCTLPADPGLPPCHIFLRNETPLTPAEALYALDVLLGWRGLRLEQVDDRTLRLVPERR